MLKFPCSVASRTAAMALMVSSWLSAPALAGPADPGEQSPTAHAAPPPLVGGWTVVDPTEARLQPIAKYIVDHWKLKQPSSPSATLTKIISAKQQVVSGIKYDIELELKPSNGSSVKVHAVVWDRFGDLKVLQME